MPVGCTKQKCPVANSRSKKNFGVDFPFTPTRAPFPRTAAVSVFCRARGGRSISAQAKKQIAVSALDTSSRGWSEVGCGVGFVVLPHLNVAPEPGSRGGGGGGEMPSRRKAGAAEFKQSAVTHKLIHPRGPKSANFSFLASSTPPFITAAANCSRLSDLRL